MARTQHTMCKSLITLIMLVFTFSGIVDIDGLKGAVLSASTRSLEAIDPGNCIRKTWALM